MITIYGIKNCGSMKKAFAWFDEHGIEYSFHDYKKQGADLDVLKKACAVHGWEQVINRKGTSWRKLPEDMRESMDEGKALQSAQDNPSLVKRPLIVDGDTILLGFDADRYFAQWKKAA
tara:strand:+ start:184 stop:537 length:354 start_codon:yes stop_codon:yes gene_type:complete